MSAYVPDPTDATQPVDSVKASTAAAEFRALKAWIQTLAGFTPTANGLTSINSGPLRGFTNQLINGNFDIWQLGTAAFTGTGYFPDMWRYGAVGNTHSATRGSFVSGDALFDPTAGNVPAPFFLQDAITSVANVANYSLWTSFIEDVRRLAGKTVTVSFWARAAAGTPSIGVNLNQFFGTGGAPSAAVGTSGQAVTLSTTWTKYSRQFTLGSMSGKTLGTTANTSATELNFWLDAGSNFSGQSGGIGQATKTVSIAQVQLEIGSTASMFEWRNPQVELALAERYYWKTYDVDTAPGTVTTAGVSQARGVGSTLLAGMGADFKTTMRIAPAVLAWNPTSGASGSIRDTSGGTNYNATASNISQRGFDGITGSGDINTNLYLGHFTADARF